MKYNYENASVYNNENEWDSNDEDEEYMETIRNDSDPIDNEPIETHPFEATFYEPIEESPQRVDVRRELMVGNENYLIQSIPKMIPSTDEHVLYKGAIFMSKDELKEIFGKFALKEKIEYRIRRPNKIHFATSCRELANLNYVLVRYRDVQKLSSTSFDKGDWLVIIFKLQHKGCII